MKNIIIAAAAFSLSLLSCKKEGGGHPKETFLSEVNLNGLKQLRFEYNPDNLLSKIEGYKTDPADNSMTSYIVFQFNGNKQIKEFTAYTMPGAVATVKATIQYDSAGRLTGATSYDLQGISPNTPHASSTFFYNAKGLVNKIVEKDKNGKTKEQTNLLYYEEGHIKEQQHWLPAGEVLYMSSKISYSLPGGYYPNGMEQLRVLLGTDFIASMYSETISHVNYTQNGDVTKHWNEQMSAREFNEDGTLKKQTTTNKYLIPVKDDQVNVEEYKYIKQ
jgi:hypothetical protein